MRIRGLGLLAVWPAGTPHWSDPNRNYRTREHTESLRGSLQVRIQGREGCCEGLEALGKIFYYLFKIITKTKHNAGLH